MSNPYGQPQYPGQGQPPGYPQPGYQQQGFPQPGYPQSGYPQPAYPALGNPSGYPATAPSSATAIIAAVLALIGGLLAGLAAVGLVLAGFSARSRYGTVHHSFSTVLIVMAIVAGLIGLLWIVGALLLMFRKRAGQIMLIGLSAFAVLSSIYSVIRHPGLGFIGLIIAVAILVLAAVPSTGHWISAGKTPPPAQPGYLPYPYA